MVSIKTKIKLFLLALLISLILTYIRLVVT